MAEIDYSRRNKYARPLSDAEKERLDEFIDAIHYSARSVAIELALRQFNIALTNVTLVGTRTTTTNTDTFNYLKRCLR
jgi:hypothetical protein